MYHKIHTLALYSIMLFCIILYFEINIIFNYTTLSGAETCAIITTTTTSGVTNKEKKQKLSRAGGKQNVNQASLRGSKHDSKSIEFNQIASNKTRKKRGP